VRGEERTVVGAGGGGGGKGGGSAGGRVPVEDPNSLRSKQYARIVDLISEGEIVGLVDGHKSIYYNDTPLQNGDGSYNFADVVIQTRPGTQAQSYIPGFEAAEAEVAVSTRVQASAAVVRSISNSTRNAVRVTLAVPQLTTQDVTTGDLRGGAVAIAIDVQTAGGGYIERLTDTISGKTMSRYQRSYEIALSGAGPWDIRVRRLTADTVAANIADQTWWDSYTEITYQKLRYPNRARIATAIDSSQFGNIPTRAYDVKGLKVRVPSNYNPDTRVYSGAWDGTFSAPAWTDNPAWVFYDLLTESRYGLGDYIAEAQVDKWSLYTIAQYCDQLVPDGFGGQEPRFTCNLYLQTREEAWRVVANLASVFRGICYWGADAIVPVQDAPASPLQLYTNANVIDGSFAYSGSGLKARHTVALVAWNDPTDGYRQKIEYVEDADGIGRYGVRETQIVALGCTSRGQAHRAGKWLLYSEQNETETVSFKVGYDGVFLRPGAVIKTADQHRAGVRLGGRVVSANTTTVTLDAAVTLPAGTNKIACMLADGTVEEKTISTSAGSGITVVNVTAAFTSAPQAGAMWVITTAAVNPELWRVVAISEEEGGQLAVTALAYNPGKYAAVEQGVQLETLPVSAVQVLPPTPVISSVTEGARTLSTGEVVLFLTVAIAQQRPVSGEIAYEVQWRIKDAGNWQSVTRYTQTVDIEPVIKGQVYQIRAIASNALGYTSQPSTIVEWTVGGKNGVPGAPTGVSATGIGEGVLLKCTLPTDADIAYVEWWASATNDRNAATKIGVSDSDTFQHLGLSPLTLRYYWCRAVNTTRLAGAWSSAVGAGVPGTAGFVLIGAGTITTTEISDNAITTPKLAANAVTAGKISVNTLSAIKANLGQINTGRIDLTQYVDEANATDPAWYSYVRTARDGGKWWNDNKRGFILAQDGNSNAFLDFDVYGANTDNRALLRMAAWGSTSRDFFLGTWKAGNPTFYIDGNGDAYFAGTLAANTVTTSNLVAKAAAMVLAVNGVTNGFNQNNPGFGAYISVTWWTSSSEYFDGGPVLLFLDVADAYNFNNTIGPEFENGILRLQMDGGAWYTDITWGYGDRGETGSTKIIQLQPSAGTHYFQLVQFHQSSFPYATNISQSITGASVYLLHTKKQS
jgi:predicted phage tail protein